MQKARARASRAFRTTARSPSKADGSSARKPKARLRRLDQVRRLLGNHDGRRIGVAADQRRHDRGIDDPKSLQSAHTQFGVHYGRVIDTHLAASRIWRRRFSGSETGPYCPLQCSASGSIPYYVQHDFRLTGYRYDITGNSSRGSGGATRTPARSWQRSLSSTQIPETPMLVFMLVAGRQDTEKTHAINSLFCQFNAGQGTKLRCFAATLGAASPALS